MYTSCQKRGRIWIDWLGKSCLYSIYLQMNSWLIVNKSIAYFTRPYNGNEQVDTKQFHPLSASTGPIVNWVQCSATRILFEYIKRIRNDSDWSVRFCNGGLAVQWNSVSRRGGRAKIGCQQLRRNSNISYFLQGSGHFSLECNPLNIFSYRYIFLNYRIHIDYKSSIFISNAQNRVFFTRTIVERFLTRVERTSRYGMLHYLSLESRPIRCSIWSNNGIKARSNDTHPNIIRFFKIAVVLQICCWGVLVIETDLCTVRLLLKQFRVVYSRCFLMTIILTRYLVIVIRFGIINVTWISSRNGRQTRFSCSGRHISCRRFECLNFRWIPKRWQLFGWQSMFSVSMYTKLGGIL